MAPAVFTATASHDEGRACRAHGKSEKRDGVAQGEPAVASGDGNPAENRVAVIAAVKTWPSLKKLMASTQPETTVNNINSTRVVGMVSTESLTPFGRSRK
ncbi:hypothetical protein GCM10025858_20350 [Alicyclobacillus sacchari]|nr:hypothetical protein GCM10025858_20350 [Alicyclobacillus sacchari]